MNQLINDYGLLLFTSAITICAILAWLDRNKQFDRAEKAEAKIIQLELDNQSLRRVVMARIIAAVKVPLRR